MGIKENKTTQHQRLKDICVEYNISFGSLEILLNSVKTKKLFKRNNYHQQKINDVIEKLKQ